MEFDPFRRRDMLVLQDITGDKGSMERFLAPAYKEEKDVAQYIVWNPTSSAPPKVIHPDRPTAIRVAGRMAHENPGQTFYVAKLTNSAQKPMPTEVSYQDLDR